MKGKSSSNSQAKVRTKAQARREYSHLCGASAVKSGVLDGIALRVIMSDIPKYKTGENTLKNAAAKTADETTEND